MRAGLTPRHLCVFRAGWRRQRRRAPAGCAARACPGTPEHMPRGGCHAPQKIPDFSHKDSASSGRFLLGSVNPQRQNSRSVVGSLILICTVCRAWCHRRRERGARQFAWIACSSLTRKKNCKISQPGVRIFRCAAWHSAPPSPPLLSNGASSHRASR